jgi:hypothetical protein
MDQVLNHPEYNFPTSKTDLAPARGCEDCRRTKPSCGELSLWNC